jgi:hypothetical protein
MSAPGTGHLAGSVHGVISPLEVHKKIARDHDILREAGAGRAADALRDGEVRECHEDGTADQRGDGIADARERGGIVGVPCAHSCTWSSSLRGTGQKPADGPREDALCRL